MRVLVIGATGFVGSRVARTLAAEGHVVTGLARPESSRDLAKDLTLEWRIARVEDASSLRAAVKGHEAVVSCLGAPPGEQLEGLHARVVRAARHVVAACRAEGVRRLLHCGSAWIYAGSERPEPSDESGHPSCARFASPEVVASALAEAEVLRGAAAGLDVVLLHPGLVVGENERSLRSSALFVEAARSRTTLCPPGGVSLIGVDDVARAHALALEKAPRGSIYLLGSENLTNRGVLDLVGDVLGRGPLAIPIPRRAARALGGLEEAVGAAVAALPLAAPALPPSPFLAREATLYRFVDASRARRELGLEPAPVKSAVAKQLEWLAGRGLLDR